MELARTAATLQSVAKMNEACSAAIREDWRGSANLYRSTYETASPEFEAWFYALDGYTSIFRMRHTTPTEADMRFIRRVEDNPAAPTLHRAHCAFSRGLLFWDSGNRAKAVHCYRHAIELAEAASPSECNAKIFFAHSHGGFRIVEAIWPPSLAVLSSRSAEGQLRHLSSREMIQPYLVRKLGSLLALISGETLITHRWPS
jgi:hypothetical protein